MKHTVARRLAATLLAFAGTGVLVTPAAAAPPTVIVLPGATSAEGIAAGEGSTFYAGDLLLGNIYRGDIEQGTAELFIDVPDGRQALGMKVNLEHDLLFVAGGTTGQAYVYNLRNRRTEAVFQLGTPEASIVNDVTLTDEGAWFTDSAQPVLYFVPLDGYGDLGDPVVLTLSGPAADVSGEFNLNGIAATEDGEWLIVAHTSNGELYRVDPDDGSSSLIAGVSVPSVDGIVLSGLNLWAVQNTENQISRIKLAADLTSGTVRDVITSDLFQTPSTAALFGHTLAVVNAKFDTGFPPTADEYEVVLVDAF